MKDPVKLAGLEITVHGRQFPDATDYWDGGWLMVSIVCESPWSRVRVPHEPAIHFSELMDFANQAKGLYEGSSSEAKLECMEPYLGVELGAVDAQGSGHIEMVVAITPVHLKESHRFTFAIDQTYLPSLVAELQEVLARHAPASGWPERES